MKANFETGLKVCSRCKRELSIDQFYKRNRTSDKLSYQCKDCLKEFDQKLLKRRKEDYKKKELSYKICSHCKRDLPIDQYTIQRSTSDGYSHYCKDCRRKFYEKNVLTGNRKLQDERWRKSDKCKSYQLNYHLKEHKLEYLVRNRLLLAVKRQRIGKSDRTMKLIGCSWKDLKKHLENQFVNGMSWDNYGEWHIDHIIPCASFDLSDPNQQRICFNFRNLQPLWAKDNLSKGSKIPDNIEELIEKLREEIGL